MIQEKDFWYKEFEKYREEVWPEVKKVHSLLNRKLSDEPSEMSRQVDEIEALFHRFTFILADAEYFLDKVEQEKIPEVIKSLKTVGLKINEFNKKVFLASACADVRKFRDKIKGTVDAISKRITWGQSKIKSERDYKNISPR